MAASAPRPGIAVDDRSAAGRTGHQHPDRRGLLGRLRGFDGIDAVIAILLWKLGTFATAYVAWALLPFNQQLYEANYRYGDRVPTSFAASFNTWDSQHYILLAEQGYQKGLLSNAFGPLYPVDDPAHQPADRR